ncbi:MAG: glycosyltransferase family 1 protein [Nitrospiraceae bacterium]|nr:MAG: glycosyltransferase family 1 protein [Nitrospiraceae bacterium]
MKIALIRKNYTPFGGAENYLALTAQKLAARGHDVHIFSSGLWPGSFTIHKIRTFKKPSFLSNMLFALKCREELKKESFDCVLSFDRTLFQDIYRAGDGCHREWLDKRAIIETPFRRAGFNINPNHLVQLYLEKKCFLNSRVIIANSMMVKKDILRHYPVAGKKIHIVYNGVDLERFRPSGMERRREIRKALNIRAEKVILFAGADFRRKGVPTLLRAFSLLNEPSAGLIIAGRKPKPEYVSMADSLGITGSVRFHGAEKRVEDLYAAADVFVLPTIYDPFSNATLEAMASGIPVVTTAYNGASELIEEGVQGFTVTDLLSAGDFAEKIAASLKNSEIMGKAARAKAENYSIENAAESFIHIINHIFFYKRSGIGG